MDMENEKKKREDVELLREVGVFLDSLPPDRFETIRSIVNLYLPQLQELHQVEDIAVYWYLCMVLNFLTIVMPDSFVSQFVSLDFRSVLFIAQIISLFPFLGYEILIGLPAREMKNVIEREIMDTGLLSETGRSVEQIMEVIAGDQFKEQTTNPVSQQTLDRLTGDGKGKKKRSADDMPVQTLGQLMSGIQEQPGSAQREKPARRRARRK